MPEKLNFPELLEDSINDVLFEDSFPKIEKEKQIIYTQLILSALSDYARNQTEYSKEEVYKTCLEQFVNNYKIKLTPEKFENKDAFRFQMQSGDDIKADIMINVLLATLGTIQRLRPTELLKHEYQNIEKHPEQSVNVTILLSDILHKMKLLESCFTSLENYEFWKNISESNEYQNNDELLKAIKNHPIG